VQTPNDLNTAYADYRSNPGAEQVSILFSALRAYVRRIVRGWNNRLSDPDDVTAQIVASVWASMSTYIGGSTFSTWTHQIARRKIIDAIRKSALAPSMTTDDRLATKTAPVADQPLMEADSLAALNEPERSLVQRLIEQPDYDALAQSLCISRKALVRRLERIYVKCERERGKIQALTD
jgi:RNA polymerase sigma factor (sigma-70 family)